MDGLDKSWIVRRVPESQPQFLDGSVKASVEFHIGVAGPELLAKFFSGNDLAGTFQKEGEHLERLVLETDSKTVLGKHTLLRIGPKQTESCEFPLLRGGVHVAGPKLSRDCNTLPSSEDRVTRSDPAL
jgi:hypothetical protein